MSTLPDLGAQRAALRTTLEQVSGVRVFAAAPVGTMPAQFVLIGMPEWRPPVDAVCAHIVEWSVMVCVSRSGTNDELTALALEGLWPQALAVLDEAIEAGGFDAVCTVASLTRAQYTPVTVSGQDFPAQIITLTMQGV